MPRVGTQTLFNLNVDEDGDCYRVALGVQDARLAFQHEDSRPEPLTGPGPLYSVRFVRPSGHRGLVKLTPHRRVIYVGDLDVPGAEHVDLDGIWVPILRSPNRWPRPYFMTGPRDFKSGVYVARWQTKRRLRPGWRTVHTQRMTLIEDWRSKP